jgi:hypothetical protein
LNAIGIMHLRLAPLVFNWEWLRYDRTSNRAELNDVRLTHKAKSKGSEGHTACYADVISCFNRTIVRICVQVTSFDSQPILGPSALNMDKRALTLAEKQVLKRRNREERILAERHSLSQDRFDSGKVSNRSSMHCLTTGTSCSTTRQTISRLTPKYS